MTTQTQKTPQEIAEEICLEFNLFRQSPYGNKPWDKLVRRIAAAITAEREERERAEKNSKFLASQNDFVLARNKEISDQVFSECLKRDKRISELKAELAHESSLYSKKKRECQLLDIEQAKAKAERDRLKEEQEPLRRDSKTANDLCRLLIDFAGEAGTSEGAVEVLKRKLTELAALQSRVREAEQELKDTFDGSVVELQARDERIRQLEAALREALDIVDTTLTRGEYVEEGPYKFLLVEWRKKYAALSPKEEGK